MEMPGPFEYHHKCNPHHQDLIHRLRAENGNLRAVASTARLLWITLGQYLSEKDRIKTDQIEKEVRNASKLLMKDLRALEDGESGDSI